MQDFMIQTYEPQEPVPETAEVIKILPLGNEEDLAKLESLILDK